MSDPKHPVPGDRSVDASDVQVTDITPELIRDPKSGRPTKIIVPQGVYKPTSYAIEPDASNATYFLALAAIHPGSKITIEGLGKGSLQGDVAFADVVELGSSTSPTVSQGCESL